MAESITKPTLGMIPLEDLCDYLALYGFSKLTNTQVDMLKNITDNINPSLIAMASNDGSKLLYDNKTIDNALKLAGKDAAEYVTKIDASNLLNLSNKLVDYYEGEIKNLRDELYQLRGELVKNGYVEDLRLYEGFQDLFSSAIKYNNKVVAKLKFAAPGPNVNELILEQFIPPADSTLQASNENPFNVLDVGDWINVFQPSYTNAQGIIVQDHDYIVQITAIDRSAQKVIIDKNLPSLTNATLIYKSKGQYTKGTYSFVNILKNRISGNEKITMMNDDSNGTLYVPITNESTVLSNSILIPSDLNNKVLSSFSIVGIPMGVPGALQCTIRNSVGKTLTSTFTPDKTAYTNADMTIKFDFSKDAENDNFITLYLKDTLTVSISSVPFGCNTNNYWKIKYGVSNPENNVNSTGYGATNNDIFYTLAGQDIQDEVESAYTEGVYTSNIISLPKPIDVSRARLMLRVNKEGQYNTIDSGLFDNCPFNINENNDPNMDTNDNVIIGDNFRSLTKFDRGNVYVNLPTYIDANDPIYRLGYKIQLKSYNLEWDDTNKVMVKTNVSITDMDIKSIVMDINKSNEMVSDRLLFEAKFETDSTPNYKTNFELQIKWTGGHKLTGGESALNKPYIGRIYDMNLILDKSL